METAELLGGPLDGDVVPVKGHLHWRVLILPGGQSRYLAYDWKLRDGHWWGVFLGYYDAACTTKLTGKKRRK